MKASWLAPGEPFRECCKVLVKGQWITYNVHNGRQYIILGVAYRSFAFFRAYLFVFVFFFFLLRVMYNEVDDGRACFRLRATIGVMR